MSTEFVVTVLATVVGALSLTSAVITVVFMKHAANDLKRHEMRAALRNRGLRASLRDLLFSRSEDNQSPPGRPERVPTGSVTRRRLPIGVEVERWQVMVGIRPGEELATIEQAVNAIAAAVEESGGRVRQQSARAPDPSGLEIGGSSLVYVLDLEAIGSVMEESTSAWAARFPMTLKRVGHVGSRSATTAGGLTT